MALLRLTDILDNHDIEYVRQDGDDLTNFKVLDIFYYEDEVFAQWLPVEIHKGQICIETTPLKQWLGY